MMAYQNTNVMYLNIQHKSGKTFSSNKFSLFKKNKNILMTKNWTYSKTTKPIQGHPEDMGCLSTSKCACPII